MGGISGATVFEGQEVGGDNNTHFRPRKRPERMCLHVVFVLRLVWVRVDVAFALLAWPVGYKRVKTTAMGAYVSPGATQVCAGKATPRSPSALLFRASVVSLRACPLRPCGLCACGQLWEVACDTGMFFRHACMRVGHDVVTRRVEDTAARTRGKRQHHLMARSAIIRESGCDGGAVIFSFGCLVCDRIDWFDYKGRGGDHHAQDAHVLLVVVAPGAAARPGQREHLGRRDGAPRRGVSRDWTSSCQRRPFHCH